MAATKTVPQLPESDNSLAPSYGVLTLIGYGIQVRVDRGHLLVEDGIGAERKKFRFPRVGHGLKRLVVIGSDGVVSLAALRWLDDQGAAFVLLERDGKVLATTGPVRPSDAKLRRAQALALQTEAGLRIARELINRKLAGQEQVVGEKLRDSAVAKSISALRAVLPNTQTLDEIRMLESRVASAYWSAWQNVVITFPRTDIPRVPEHWRRFDTRKSPLSGSPRLAANPANAMLNYLYAVLESEARLAAAALGLDPGLGILHLDTAARDSFACDLMEAVRPQVDRYVLDWILSQPLRREWFFEQRDGNCRLMASLATRLSETAQVWARAIAPVAEWVVEQLWSTTCKRVRRELPPARLTQAHKREAKGSTYFVPTKQSPTVERICRGCGVFVTRGHDHCKKCGNALSTEALIKSAEIGRIAAHSPMARQSRVRTKRRHDIARQAWLRSGQVAIDEAVYTSQIQPGLTALTNAAIAAALGVSLVYAADIRRGKRRPHPRHWNALAKLVGFRAE